MNKEQVITVLIGLLVGALAVSGYFAAKNFLPKFIKPPIAPVVSKKAEETKPPSPMEIELTIEGLVDHSSTASATINITGQTAPGASILLFGNAQEQIASADASGKFATTLKLEDGENEISLTAFLARKNSAVIRRNVTLEISQWFSLFFYQLY